MTTDELIELFRKHDDECLKFDRVANKSSLRPDLHAFILLDRLLPPSDRDIVCAAEHDEFFLDPAIEELASVISEAQVIELIRCGVHYDSDTDSFSMFCLTYDHSRAHRHHSPLQRLA